MKGIILAGGKGTRLLPATKVVNKHMVPILNRPMITYPLETLRSLGIENVMVVSGGNHLGSIAEFLGDGRDFEVDLTYRVQKDAGGIAQALSLAEDFAHGERIAVILGDNVFGNDYFRQFFSSIVDMAHIFIKSVKDPHRFGVLSGKNGIYRIDEKPKEPASNKAVTGLYIFPSTVFDIVEGLKPSARGELEITDVNNAFIDRRGIVVHDIGDTFWSDAGTRDSLYEVTRHAYDTEK